MNLKKNSTQPLPFLLIDSSDHISGKTEVTPTVVLSKNGSSFAAPVGAVTEVGNGWYKLTPTSVDTGTLGALVLHATGTGCDPLDMIYEVVAYDPAQADIGIWAAALSGFTDATTAGGALKNVNSKVSLLGLLPTNILPTQYTYTPNTTVAVSIVRGDDYTNEVGAITFSSSTWLNLTAEGTVVTMTARTADSSEIQVLESTGTVTASDGVQTVTFQPTHTQTAALPVGTHNFDVQATLEDTTVKTLLMGTLTVKEDYTR